MEEEGLTSLEIYTQWRKRKHTEEGLRSEIGSHRMMSGCGH